MRLTPSKCVVTIHNFPSLTFTGAGSSDGCSRGLEPPAGGCTQALDDGQGKPRMRPVLIDFGMPPLSLLLASVEMCSTSVCKSLRNLQEKRVRRGLAPQQMLFFATVRLSRPQARAAAKAAAASSSQDAQDAEPRKIFPGGIPSPVPSPQKKTSPVTKSARALRIPIYFSRYTHLWNLGCTNFGCASASG